MINQHAIQLLEFYFQNSDLAFTLFQARFENNVNTYLALKNRLHAVNVSEDELFQGQFANFYLVKRLPRPAKVAFFREFESLKNEDIPINVRELTEEMAPALGKMHFSFCSKMMNMINDEEYPIYDSNVATVFHRPGLGYGLDYKNNLYQDLCDTYHSLENHPLVETFRVRFHANGMGYMKVLDTLFWFVGYCMNTNNLTEQ